jgi:hypothetical protein
MDRLYKSLFVQAVKQGMADGFPDFTPVSVQRDAPLRDIFSGALLFCSEAYQGGAVWLCWEPGPGVERRFDVRLGWSPNRHVLPAHGQHDSRIYALRAPSSDFPACSISLQQVLGERAIGAYIIPTPWDPLYNLSPSTPAREQRQVMQKACAEAQALSQDQRLGAIEETLAGVFASLRAALPAFARALQPRDA